MHYYNAETVGSDYAKVHQVAEHKRLPESAFVLSYICKQTFSSKTMYVLECGLWQGSLCVLWGLMEKKSVCIDEPHFL